MKRDKAQAASHPMKPHREGTLENMVIMAKVRKALAKRNGGCREGLLNTTQRFLLSFMP